VAGRWDACDLVVSSVILLHVHHSIIFHVVLSEHGVTTGSWRDLLQPLLVISLNVPVVIDLTESCLDWHLGTIDDISNARLSILAVLFLDGLVVFHLTFKVTEVLADRLIS
jgi:hypothetical protein